MIRQILNRAPASTRPILRRIAGLMVNRWPDYCRLFLIGENAEWVIFWEMVELAAIARKIGIKIATPRLLSLVRNQAVFYGSQFILLADGWLKQPQRTGIAYFHGRPGTGVPEFDRSYQRLCLFHQHVHRIQVSHGEMREIVLSTGIEPEKVFLIPIGINLTYFPMKTSQSQRRAREKLGIPQSAVAIGSFQKDGVGWGDGLEPKFIKGPDVFLKTVELLKPRIPELFVLLGGPARGFIKTGLERLGVPYRHVFLRHYPEVCQLFQTLDVYLVSSRQEGGPKAVLEAMASGVPLVTTRVGQAMDLVRHGENGWMVDVDNAEALAHWAEYVIRHRKSLDGVLLEGRKTAEDNSYKAQIPLWTRFMRGFVEW